MNPIYFHVHPTDGPPIELTMANLWKLPVTSKGKEVQIILRAAASFRKIGYFLLNDDDGTIVKSLVKADSTDTLCEIFEKWLRKHPERSWRKLVDCLKYCDLGNLAEDVEAALNL